MTRKKGFSFKLPDRDEIGIAFIKGALPIMTKNKLIGIKGILESYPDSEQKNILIEHLKKEFEKRHLEYDKI